MKPILEKLDVPGFEEVYKVTESETGLLAIIAIHNTQMGPALGGLRIFPYNTFDDALEDVLRLAEGMTYKSLIIEAGLGGGKAVISWDRDFPITEEALKVFAQAVNSLEGRYITAEDYGVTPAHLLTIREETPYVVGIESADSSGNPSPCTAWGVFRGIQATLDHLYGSPSLAGKTIALQGLGHVGSVLAEFLFWHGADLVVTDIDPERIESVCRRFDARAVAPNEILDVKCDLFAPCALGGVLNPESIERLRCKAVAGSTNNQLSNPSDADLLAKRGILYAPDYIINAGGLINVQAEVSTGGYKPSRARDEINKIKERLKLVYTIAEKNSCSTEAAAMALAQHKLKFNIGKRHEEICVGT